jgi:2'-5' RNA ligase
MRTFIGCGIYHKGIDHLVEEMKKTGADIKFIEPQNTHVTLKFLGEIEEEIAGKVGDVMKRICHGAFPIEARLARTGVFPNQNYMRVLWVGIVCPDLERIQHELDEALVETGFKLEKNFKPHLTIGRIRSAKNKQRILETLERFRDIEIGEFVIESIKLKKSILTPKGPVYSDLRVVS